MRRYATQAKIVSAPRFIEAPRNFDNLFSYVLSIGYGIGRAAVERVKTAARRLSP